MWYCMVFFISGTYYCGDVIVLLVDTCFNFLVRFLVEILKIFGSSLVIKYVVRLAIVMVVCQGAKTGEKSKGVSL